VHANGDVYDKAARNMGYRAGILRRDAGRADRQRPDAPTWLANPEAVIPIMAYRQPEAGTRAAIIACLKELN
jgi:hypothetical protein